MVKQQLSAFELISLLIWAVMGTGVLTLPWAIGQFVVRDAWISGLLIIVIQIIVAMLVTWYVRVLPNQSLVEGLQTALGPWLGRLLAVWFLLWLYLLNAMIVREMTLFLEETVLPRTPIYVLSGLFVLAAAYAVSQGIETMGRVAQLLTPFAFVITAALFVFALPQADFHQIAPVLADGWLPVWRGAVLPWTWSVELVTVLQFVTTVKNAPKTLGKYVLLSGALMALLGVFAEIIITSVLGYQRTSAMFPVLEVVRTIHVGQFFERLDPLYVMGATVLIAIKTSVFQYAMVTGIQQVFKLQSGKSVIWSGALAVWAGSIFLWRESADLGNYMIFTVPTYYLSTMLLLPLCASGVQTVRRKWFPASVASEKKA
ncbi:MAG: hypothetical protein A2201_12855 [Alicyclobacillus sp. RIFOXYA1_FULL_53_8]|nr:MAG: hypothetical protein A2201_12855 [Alicyclobacillus sp. RIFOXYA1_FULL_53_8]